MSEDEKIKCGNCGEEIDSSESKCPHCGADIEEEKPVEAIDLREVQSIRNRVEIEQIQRALGKEKDRE
jgi:tRNA(Ile2) C34 agmatinyltransferase TiaS